MIRGTALLQAVLLALLCAWAQGAALIADINDDGRIDAEDRALRDKGTPEIMRWYDPVCLKDGTTPDSAYADEFGKAAYAQPVTIDGGGDLTCDVPGVAFFADAACTKPLGRKRTPNVIYVLAVPPKDGVPSLKDATLALRNADATASLKLRIVGRPALDNPHYFSAGYDALVEQGRPVFADVIHREFAMPARLVAVPAARTELRMLVAAKYGVKSVYDAVNKRPEAAVIASGCWYPAKPTTFFGGIPKASSAYVIDNYRAMPLEYENGWREGLGYIVQRCPRGSAFRVGEDTIEAGVSGTPKTPMADIRSGIGGLDRRCRGFFVLPRTIMGHAIAKHQNRAMVFVAVSEWPLHRRWTRDTDHPGAFERVKARFKAGGATMVGNQDGGPSCALAYRAPDGKLKVVCAEFSHTGGRPISNYMILKVKTNDD